MVASMGELDDRPKVTAEFKVPQHRGLRGALSEVAEVNGLAADASSSRIFAAAGDSNAYCWDVETGSVLNTFRGHLDYLQCVTFLERSSVLATGSEDGSLKLWDVRQSGNDAVCTMKLAEDGASGTSSYVMCSTASTSEDWLAFGGSVRGIGRLSACHVPSRKMLSSVPVKEYGCVQSVAYFDDGGDLATVGDSPEILHWTVDATSRTRQVSSSSSSLYTIAQSEKIPCTIVAGASPSSTCTRTSAAARLHCGIHSWNNCFGR